MVDNRLIVASVLVVVLLGGFGVVVLSDHPGEYPERPRHLDADTVERYAGSYEATHFRRNIHQRDVRVLDSAISCTDDAADRVAVERRLDSGLLVYTSCAFTWTTRTEAGTATSDDVVRSLYFVNGTTTLRAEFDGSAWFNESRTAGREPSIHAFNFGNGSRAVSLRVERVEPRDGFADTRTLTVTAGTGIEVTNPVPGPGTYRFAAESGTTATYNWTAASGDPDLAVYLLTGRDPAVYPATNLTANG